MIQVFVTGGTFDKDYNFITGELYFKDTHLKQMFERGRCTLDTDVKTLMMIDSLEMTKEDRQIIAHNCRRTSAENIIIMGFSRGAFITGLTSDKLSDLAVDTIILAGCGRLVSGKHTDIKVYGDVLSVYEKTDRANTCKALKKKK